MEDKRAFQNFFFRNILYCNKTAYLHQQGLHQGWHLLGCEQHGGTRRILDADSRHCTTPLVVQTQAGSVAEKVDTWMSVGPPEAAGWGTSCCLWTHYHILYCDSSKKACGCNKSGTINLVHCLLQTRHNFSLRIYKWMYFFMQSASCVRDRSQMNKTRPRRWRNHNPSKY